MADKPQTPAKGLPADTHPHGLERFPHGVLPQPIDSETRTQVPPVRKARFEWKVDEKDAAGLLRGLKTGIKMGPAGPLPHDVEFQDAGILETPPAGAGYRYIWAEYQAKQRAEMVKQPVASNILVQIDASQSNGVGDTESPLLCLSLLPEFFKFGGCLGPLYYHQLLAHRWMFPASPCSHWALSVLVPRNVSAKRRTSFHRSCFSGAPWEISVLFLRHGFEPTPKLLSAHAHREVFSQRGLQH